MTTDFRSDALTTQLSGHEFDLLSEPNLYSHSNFISLFNVDVSFRSLADLLEAKSCTGNHVTSGMN